MLLDRATLRIGMHVAKILHMPRGLVQVLSDEKPRLPKQGIPATTVDVLPRFKELGMQHQAHHTGNILGG
jgi:hypothetical protein